MTVQIYCPRCRQKVNATDLVEKVNTRGYRYVQGICPQCRGKTIAKILGKAQAGGAVPVGAIVKPVADTITSITNAANQSGNRSHEKKQLDGWYDRVASKNIRIANRKDLAAMAKMVDYIKKEWVKERGLKWSDKEIWEYVMNKM